MTDTLKELVESKKNRKAVIGVFIFSKSRAPEDIEPLTRYGDDIVVVWDANDTSTDVFVKAAMSLARALVIGKYRESKLTTADLAAMVQAIVRITNDAKMLESVVRMAETVRNNGEKIRDQADRFKEKLAEQIDVLEEHLEALRCGSGDDED